MTGRPKQKWFILWPPNPKGSSLTQTTSFKTKRVKNYNSRIISAYQSAISSSRLKRKVTLLKIKITRWPTVCCSSKPSKATASPPTLWMLISQFKTVIFINKMITIAKCFKLKIIKTSTIKIKVPGTRFHKVQLLTSRDRLLLETLKILILQITTQTTRHRGAISITKILKAIIKTEWTSP